jgi:hypothetical protein
MTSDAPKARDTDLINYLKAISDREHTVWVYTQHPMLPENMPVKGKINYVGEDFITVHGRQTDRETIVRIAAITGLVVPMSGAVGADLTG